MAACVRYVIASYSTPERAEAMREVLAGAGIASDLLPPSPRWTARLARALQGRGSEVRLGVEPDDVERARQLLALPGCRRDAS
jgi:cell division protein FtsN